MEWIVIGVVAWWWCTSRSKARIRKAERAAQLGAAHPVWPQTGKQWVAAPPETGPWVMNGIILAVADDFAYWRADGQLLRAPWRHGCADLDRIEHADPLACADLQPALVVEILDALDAAERDIRRPRTTP